MIKRKQLGTVAILVPVHVWHFFGNFFRKVIDKNTYIRKCLPQNLGLFLVKNRSMPQYLT